MGDIQFVAVTLDEARLPPRSTDLAALTASLNDLGFSSRALLPDDEHTCLEVSHRDLVEAHLSVDSDWLVVVSCEHRYLSVSHDEAAGLRGGDALTQLIGCATAFADSYVGCISSDPEDDLSFLFEERPSQILQPLTLMYFGRRYLEDWEGTPAFASGADLNTPCGGGRIVVPSLHDLT